MAIIIGGGGFSKQGNDLVQLGNRLLCQEPIIEDDNQASSKSRAREVARAKALQS
ncbi:MAG: hypothetical protein ABI284_08385 [Nitrosospira sp.]